MLSSDAIRQELFGRSAVGQVAEVNRYQPESRENVYQEMLRRAAGLHRQGISVVLDATFSNVANTLAARALAKDLHSLFLAIECCCPREVARQRIATRLRTGRDASESRPEVHDEQRFRWEPWPDAIPQVRVNTQRPLAEQSQQVVSELSARWPP